MLGCDANSPYLLLKLMLYHLHCVCNLAFITLQHRECDAKQRRFFVGAWLLLGVLFCVYEPWGRSSHRFAATSTCTQDVRTQPGFRAKDCRLSCKIGPCRLGFSAPQSISVCTYTLELPDTCKHAGKRWDIM